MNRLISVFLSFITAISGLFVIPANEVPSYIQSISDEDICLYSENSGFVKDTLLVIFEEDATMFDKISVFAKADGICVGKISDLELYIIRTSLSDIESADKISRNLTSLDSVLLASVCPAKKYEEQYTPDDPFIDDNGYGTNDWDDENPDGNNWHIEATDTRSAWGYKDLFTDIKLGIVDGGFDTDHEELDGKISFPSKREERRNRPNHHGTHVAGIISAKQDNGVGISGVCPSSSLVCVDWSPSTNQLWIGDLEILTGFKKVVKAGAKVINFSVGSSGSVGEEKYAHPSFVKNLDALLYSYAMGNLLKKGYDFIVVQSAGNGNDGGYAIDASQNGIFCAIDESNAFLPFKGINVNDLLDRIIVVGSAKNTENGYIQSDSSNIGEKVDICAPGYDIYSSTKDDTYLKKTGTSMAAPMVTGVAGLVWSVNTTLTGPQVKKIVCENTEDIVLPAEKKHFDFLDYQTYPLVNAKLAVEAALKAKEGFYQISVSAGEKEEITFISESGNRFVFETDSSGNLTCVLENGKYTASAGNITKEFTVSSETSVDF